MLREHEIGAIAALFAHHATLSLAISRFVRIGAGLLRGSELSIAQIHASGNEIAAEIASAFLIGAILCTATAIGAFLVKMRRRDPSSSYGASILRSMTFLSAIPLLLFSILFELSPDLAERYMLWIRVCIAGLIGILSPALMATVIGTTATFRGNRNKKPSSAQPRSKSGGEGGGGGGGAGDAMLLEGWPIPTPRTSSQGMPIKYRDPTDDEKQAARESVVLMAPVEGVFEGRESDNDDHNRQAQAVGQRHADNDNGGGSDSDWITSAEHSAMRFWRVAVSGWVFGVVVAAESSSSSGNSSSPTVRGATSAAAHYAMACACLLINARMLQTIVSDAVILSAVLPAITGERKKATADSDSQEKETLLARGARNAQLPTRATQEARRLRYATIGLACAAIEIYAHVSAAALSDIVSSSNGDSSSENAIVLVEVLGRLLLVGIALLSVHWKLPHPRDMELGVAVSITQTIAVFSSVSIATIELCAGNISQLIGLVVPLLCAIAIFVSVRAAYIATVDCIGSALCVQRQIDNTVAATISTEWHDEHEEKRNGAAVSSVMSYGIAPAAIAEHCISIAATVTVSRIIGMVIWSTWTRSFGSIYAPFAAIPLFVLAQKIAPSASD